MLTMVNTLQKMKCQRLKGDSKMKLDRIIAVRNNKTIYRDGDKCIKVFNEDYSKSDILAFSQDFLPLTEIMFCPL